jgi:octaheme c-type cytochrome (tetrathionate reductase family)
MLLPTPATDPLPAAGGKKVARVFAWALIALTLVAMAFVTLTMVRAGEKRPDNPWKHMPQKRGHVDHLGMMKGPFPDGHSVTTACLMCHPQAGKEMLESEHFTWLGDQVEAHGRGAVKTQQIGKRNLLNNFCLSVESNWPRCTNCHAGYGWKDGNFDFSKVENVDCLICHDQTGTYRKDLAGVPGKEVNLVAVAASVGLPTRENCGSCHFAGGGGDAVKHGDLDGTLGFPRERIDVHMGRYDLTCIDCHQTKAHKIPGQSLSVAVSGTSRVECTECHESTPHQDSRLNQHTSSVACPTCHIPVMAIDAPTKMVWDWSTAGQNVGVSDPHRYLKEKGSFVYAQKVEPEYYWYDGTGDRYLKGDVISSGQVVALNKPHGSIQNAKARIWPFKVHRGKQPYDKVHLTLMVAKTYGEGGFWTEFDWDKALRLGSQASGLPYSGSYGFATTEMYWPLAHMVQPGERALQCQDCHGTTGRMPWKALGYTDDPGRVGGRQVGMLLQKKGGPSL